MTAVPPSPSSRAESAALAVLEAAPDAIEPVLGWRAWYVAAHGGAFRLRSVLFPTFWWPGAPLAGTCLRRETSLMRWLRRVPPCPGAPGPRCECGVYAATLPGGARAYLESVSQIRLWPHAARAFGRVRLWGAVVEYERGWRAEYAYPASIYLPTGAGRCSTDRVAADLVDYGVPVEVIAGRGGSFASFYDDVVGREQAAHG